MSRYTILTGSYGQYFYDQANSRPMPLAEVLRLINKENVVAPIKPVKVKKNRVTVDKLFALMAEKKITQKALADVLDCSDKRISELHIKKPNASKWRPGELVKAYLWVQSK